MPIKESLTKSQLIDALENAKDDDSGCIMLDIDGEEFGILRTVYIDSNGRLVLSNRDL